MHIDEPWRTIGYALLAAILALLIVGFARSPYQRERAGRLPKIFQLPQSFLLIALAALVWLTAARGTPREALAALICVGIAFGFLGDLFMANVFHQKNPVLFGMGAFAIGHVLYMLAFRELALAFDLHDLGRYALAIGLTTLAAVALWWLLVRKPGGGAIQYIALIYGLFLATMAGYALGLALHDGRFASLALGGLLFVLSDTLIAARLFAGRGFAFIGDAIWVTYIAAQVLIVTIVPTISTVAPPALP